MQQTRLTESPEYDKKREDLRRAEIDLMQQRERVAQMRRELPLGAAVPDYEFLEGPRDLVAAAEPAPLRAHARARGWDQLRLLSAGSNTFKHDLRSEDDDGSQDSTVSVFTRDADGTIRHRYTSHPWTSDDVRERGIDLLSPVWHLLDLTPQGRGDWYASLSYE